MGSPVCRAFAASLHVFSPLGESKNRGLVHLSGAALAAKEAEGVHRGVPEGLLPSILGTCFLYVSESQPAAPGQSNPMKKHQRISKGTGHHCKGSMCDVCFAHAAFKNARGRGKKDKKGWRSNAAA